MKGSICILLSLLVASNSFADGQGKWSSPEFMKEQMAEASKEYHAITGEMPPGEEDPQASLDFKSLAKLTNQISTSADKTSENLLSTLASQVDAIRSKSEVEKATILATQSARKVKVRGARTIFNYREDEIYEVFAGVDHITDIQLKPGEQLTNAPMSGDTVRWTLGVMKSGSSQDETTHIIIKPLEENLETNLIITTNYHVYQLRLRSGDTHMPSVAWNYPADFAAKMQNAVIKESKEEPTTVPVEQIQFNYEIDGDDPDWKPLRVFDDGSKTFLQMPKKMRTSEAPALFVLDEDGNPILVNYRVKGDYYIADRLFKRAELRVGTSDKVTIELDDGRTFFGRLFN